MILVLLFAVLPLSELNHPSSARRQFARNQIVALGTRVIPEIDAAQETELTTEQRLSLQRCRWLIEINWCEREKERLAKKGKSELPGWEEWVQATGDAPEQYKRVAYLWFYSKHSSILEKTFEEGAVFPLAEFQEDVGYIACLCAHAVPYETDMTLFLSRYMSPDMATGYVETAARKRRTCTSPDVWQWRARAIDNLIRWAKDR